MNKGLMLFWVILGITVILGIIFFIIGKQSNVNINSTPPKFDANIIDEQNNVINEVNMENIERNPDKVTMTIKNGTLTKTGATVIITDNNDQPYGYGKWFKIEKKENEEWKKLNLIDENYSFDSIAFNLRKDRTFEDKIDWTNIYGELEKGEYKLIKNVYDGEDKYFSVEFTID